MPTSPPDQAARELIVTALDRNLLVEAAAGTGKTTSMVGRMIALLRTGRCAQIRTLAAVTFTRKAAAELRSRFQEKLAEAAQKAEGEEQARLRGALSQVEQCSIGTIHSFCARLLRERPVEAGVDLAFEEMEEEDDQRLLEEAWAEYGARSLAEGAPEVEELQKVGLQLGDLEGSFHGFVTYPDVEEWPAPEVAPPEVAPPDVEETRRGCGAISRRWKPCTRSCPRRPGNDGLIPKLKRLPRVMSHYDLDDLTQFMEALEHFDTSAAVVQKEWAKTGVFEKEDAKAEQARWEDFRAGVVAPCLRAWREYRYPRVLAVLRAAAKFYDARRQDLGLLNFQDLLLKSAALLRGQPHVRRYFGERFTHVLVDEFQDTDPIQAEVMLLLTASDPEERDWRACVPRPGALFVVGDPKQSIYRFRRADIVTYNEVKEIIARHGEVVQLSANFRTVGEVVQWVNGVFAPEGVVSGLQSRNNPREEDVSGLKSRNNDGGAEGRFPEVATNESPSYVPLDPAREEGEAGDWHGLYSLTVPADYTQQEFVVKYEAKRIARTIRDALDRGVRVARREGEDPRVRPDDFLIITRNTARLSVYARALQELGIPHQVTGGAALNESPELKLLYLCLKAVTQPDNPVALVAALRSELFGMSDRALYFFKLAGGEFSYNKDLPQALAAEDAPAWADAFDRLQRYWRWLSVLPPVAAVEKIVADLGLMARAAARPGGDGAAGGLAKALELLRAGQGELWSTGHLVEYLARLVNREERYDGLSARSGEESVVRIMNLHKVKGLEAPVVFLADPYGEGRHEPELHIDRAEDAVRGYLVIYGSSNSFVREVLAVPPGWEACAAREKAFAAAETLRLRYVAATRAGAAMIVTQTAKKNSYNPWNCFGPHLPKGRELPDPGPQAAPVFATVTVSAAEAEASAARDGGAPGRGRNSDLPHPRGHAGGGGGGTFRGAEFSPRGGSGFRAHGRARAGLGDGDAPPAATGDAIPHPRSHRPGAGRADGARTRSRPGAARGGNGAGDHGVGVVGHARDAARGASSKRPSRFSTSEASRPPSSAAR